MVDAVQLVRLPYHLSAVTQATALAALEHTDTLLGYVEQLKTERDRLVGELRAAGYEVTDSDANFVQFGRFERRPHAVWQGILGPRASWSATTASPAGCGSPPAPRPRTTRSSTRYVI